MLMLCKKKMDVLLSKVGGLSRSLHKMERTLKEQERKSFCIDESPYKVRQLVAVDPMHACTLHNLEARLLW